jgi:hypothetical protein
LDLNVRRATTRLSGLHQFFCRASWCVPFMREVLAFIALI